MSVTPLTVSIRFHVSVFSYFGTIAEATKKRCQNYAETVILHRLLDRRLVVNSMCAFVK